MLEVKFTMNLLVGSEPTPMVSYGLQLMDMKLNFRSSHNGIAQDTSQCNHSHGTCISDMTYITSRQLNLSLNAQGFIVLWRFFYSSFFESSFDPSSSSSSWPLSSFSPPFSIDDTDHRQGIGGKKKKIYSINVYTAPTSPVNNRYRKACHT